MPANTAENCAGSGDITADTQGVGIAAGTGIADIGAAMFTLISTAFRTATTIPTGHAAIMARHGAADGIVDACGAGDTVTAITEVACATMVAARAE